MLRGRFRSMETSFVGRCDRLLLLLHSRLLPLSYPAIPTLKLLLIIHDLCWVIHDLFFLAVHRWRLARTRKNQRDESYLPTGDLLALYILSFKRPAFCN